MTLIPYPSAEAVEAAKAAEEPLLVLVAFDGGEALVSPLDEAVEHTILLTRLQRSPLEIDRYFRIVLDSEGADWTFVCPPDYRGIRDKRRRIEAFYRDGFACIPLALQALGYLVGIQIPRRYRRHFALLGD